MAVVAGGADQRRVLPARPAVYAGAGNGPPGASCFPAGPASQERGAGRRGGPVRSVRRPARLVTDASRRPRYPAGDSRPLPAAARHAALSHGDCIGRGLIGRHRPRPGSAARSFQTPRQKWRVAHGAPLQRRRPSSRAARDCGPANPADYPRFARRTGGGVAGLRFRCPRQRGRAD